MRTGGGVLLDVLPSRAAGLEGLDVQVIGNDGHVHVALRLREHLDEREGGVTCMGGVVGREADQPVHAALRLGVAVGVWPGQLHRGALDPRLFTWGYVEDQWLEAVALAPADVHPEQRLSPVLRLSAARAGVDRDDRVAVVVLAREDQLDLACGGLIDDRRSLGGELVKQGVVRRLRRQIDELDGRLEALAEPTPSLDRPVQPGDLTHRGLRGPGVVPEAGLGGERL